MTKNIMVLADLPSTAIPLLLLGTWSLDNPAILYDPFPVSQGDTTAFGCFTLRRLKRCCGIAALVKVLLFDACSADHLRWGQT